MSMITVYLGAMTSAGTPAGFNVAAYVSVVVIGLVFTSLVGGFMFYKVLEKGHQPGWAAFVPFYNYALLFKMSGRNPALALLFVGGYLPVIGIIFSITGFIMLARAVGKAFGKDTGFIVGLVLLSIIFFPILGFGSSRYLPDGEAPPQGFEVLPPRPEV